MCVCSNIPIGVCIPVMAWLIGTAVVLGVSVYVWWPAVTVLYRAACVVYKKATISRPTRKRSIYERDLPPFPVTWYPACRDDHVRAGIIYPTKLAGQELVLVRDSAGVVRALPRACPHMGVDLSMGTVHGDCITCPFHGKCIDATTTPTAFPTQSMYGFVFVWLGAAEPSSMLPNRGNLRPLWMPWNTFVMSAHPIDLAEHPLDYAHVPYVHTLVPAVRLGTTPFVPGVGGWVNYLVGGVYGTVTFDFPSPLFGIFDLGHGYRALMVITCTDANEMSLHIYPLLDGWLDTLKSVIVTLYVLFDFRMEVAFFNNRDTVVYQPMHTDDYVRTFRAWYRREFYSEEQLALFARQKAQWVNRAW